MSFETKGSAYVSIKVEGIDLDFYNLINEIQIIEHTSYFVPVAHIVLFDVEGRLRKELTIQDGTKITLAIGVNKDTALPYHFSVFSTMTGSSSETDVYKINCLLDVPKYISKAVRTAIKGTSNSALSTIASDADLTYDGTATDDDQVWLGLGITASLFAHSICKRGWANESSAMMVCLATDKTLIYKDINAQIVGQTTETFNLNKYAKGEHTINESDFYNNAGFRNSWVGSGQYRYVDTIEGERLLFDRIKLPSLGGSAPINQTIKTSIEFARVDTDDYVCGNTHHKYELAGYQNLRLKSLYSQMGSLLLRDQSSVVKLLDPIKLSVGDLEGAKYKQPVDGNWLVMARTRIIRGNFRYGERIEIMRPYVTEPGVTPLVQY